MSMIQSFLVLSAIRGTVATSIHPAFLTSHPRALSFRLQHPFIQSQSPTTIRWIGKKARARKRREKDRARSRYQNMVRDQKKLLRLHPAAQWKRILSACDFWFSNANLVNDDFLRTELKNYGGWCRISCLLTFPKLKHWANPGLLVAAFNNAGPRYQLKDSPHDSKNKNKLVRKRGITLEHIEILECNPELYQTDNTAEIEERAVARRKQRSLKNYKTDKKIVVVKHPQQLPKLCDQIRKSIQESVDYYGTEDASVLAMDAEYATLDEDIRPRLPAMLQISAPQGPVGLIWLDKFPNHGRDVLNHASYAPLASLLADSSIVKTGVGVSQDAKHLCSWWGINDREYIGHFISRLEELSDAPELATFLSQDRATKVSWSKLESLCALVLKRDLVKRKTNKKDSKKSHWRAPELTEKMKTYAAHDVACAIDIWMALKATEDRRDEEHGELHHDEAEEPEDDESDGEAEAEEELSKP